VLYAVFPLHRNYNGQNSFLLFQAAILIVLWLPGLRAFYSHILQDWTLLSYGLYGIILFLYSLIDKDETPRLNLLVLLPSLLTLGAALAHLRIRSAFFRMAALLAGVYTRLLTWMIPIFQGLTSGWVSVGFVMLPLMGFTIILTAIILVPLLVQSAIHSWRASRAGR
jgi:hypothetical protein